MCIDAVPVLQRLWNLGEGTILIYFWRKEFSELWLPLIFREISPSLPNLSFSAFSWAPLFISWMYWLTQGRVIQDRIFPTNSVSQVSFGVHLGLSNFPLSNPSLKVRMYYFNFILFVMPGWHSSLWKEELKGTLCSGCAGEPADVLWTVSSYMKEHTDLSTPVRLCLFWFLCAFPLPSPQYKASLETILMLLSLPSNGMENKRRKELMEMMEKRALLCLLLKIIAFFSRVQPLYSGARCTKGKWVKYFSLFFFFLEWVGQVWNVFCFWVRGLSHGFQ